MLAGAAALAAGLAGLLGALVAPTSFVSLTGYWLWDFGGGWAVTAFCAPLLVAGIITLTTLRARPEWSLACSAAGVLFLAEVVSYHLSFKSSGLFAGAPKVNSVFLALALLAAVAAAVLAPMGLAAAKHRLRFGAPPGGVVVVGLAAVVAVVLAGACVPIRFSGGAFFDFRISTSSARLLIADLLRIFVPAVCVGVATFLGRRVCIATAAVVETFVIVLLVSTIRYLEPGVAVASGMVFEILATGLLVVLAVVAASGVDSERNVDPRAA